MNIKISDYKNSKFISTIFKAVAFVCNIYFGIYFINIIQLFSDGGSDFYPPVQISFGFTSILLLILLALVFLYVFLQLQKQSHTTLIWLTFFFMVSTFSAMCFAPENLFLAEKIIVKNSIDFYYAIVPLINIYIFLFLFVFSLLFYGIFQMQKWILPLLFWITLFSAVNLSSIIFLPKTANEEAFSILNFLSIFCVIFFIIAFFYRENLKGKTMKLGIQIPFTIISTPLLLFGTLSTIFPDLTTVEDSDLIPNLDIQLPEANENAYFLLSEIHVNEIDNEYCQASDYLYNERQCPWNQVKIDFILSENNSNIQKIREASNYESYLCSGNDCSSVFREKWNLIKLSSLSQTKKRNYEQSFEDLLSIFKIGELIQKAPYNEAFDYLLGSSMMQNSMLTIQTIINEYQISSNILLKYISEISNFPHSAEGLKEVIKLSHYSAKVDFLRDVMGYSNFYFQPNRTISEYAKENRANIEISELPCYKVKDALKKQKEEIKQKTKISWWKIIFTRNAFFEMSHYPIDYESVFTKQCESIALIEQTRLQMAIKAYEYDNGRQPKTQSELVSDYISEPIRNPLTNEIFTIAEAMSSPLDWRET